MKVALNASSFIRPYQKSNFLAFIFLRNIPFVRGSMKAKPRFGQFVPGHSKPLMAMIKVTNRCSMACPVCFTDANHLANDLPDGLSAWF